MSRGNKLMIGTLAVLALGLLAFVVSRLEPVEITIEGEFEGEALQNPLLAAARLLEQLDMPVETRRNMHELPAHDHTLILNTTGHTIDPNRAEELVEWAAQGGNLIMIVPTRGGLSSLLFEDLEEQRAPLAIWRALGIEVSLRDDSEQELCETHNEDIQSLVIGAEVFTGQFESCFALELLDDSPGELVPGQGSDCLLSLRVGAGLVTVVASDAWACNAWIGEHDHARLLWRLASAKAELASARAGTWVIRSATSPGLLAILLREAWALFISSIVLLCIWLWSRAARFGPLMAVPARERRDFSEHVEAAAEYLWRNGASARLLEAPRKELQRRLQHTRPAWTRSTPEQLVEHLSTHSNLPVNEISEALTGDAHHNSQAFTRMVKNLLILRRSL